MVLQSKTAEPINEVSERTSVAIEIVPATANRATTKSLRVIIGSPLLVNIERHRHWHAERNKLPVFYRRQEYDPMRSLNGVLIQAGIQTLHNLDFTYIPIRSNLDDQRNRAFYFLSSGFFSITGLGSAQDCNGSVGHGWLIGFLFSFVQEAKKPILLFFAPPVF